MHLVQRAGLPGDCLYPARLNIRPPSPANGAAHSLQRGGDGIRRNNRRWLARPGLSPVSTARTFSGVNPSAAICSIYLRQRSMPASILTAALDQLRGASTAEPRRPGSDQARAQAQIKAARSQPAEPCERSANDHHPRFTTRVEQRRQHDQRASHDVGHPAPSVEPHQPTSVLRAASSALTASVWSPASGVESGSGI